MSFRRNIKSGVINAAGDVSANESPTSLHSSALAAGSSMIGLVAPGKQHLCSCGHRELDTILGGGFQFGSVSAILEDDLTSYADSLMAYAVAEAVIQEHNIAIVCANSAIADKLFQNLPFKQPEDTDIPDAAAAPSFDGGHGLRIAWQYGKYLNKGLPTANTARNLIKSSKRFCHSYDISKRLQDKFLASCNICVICPTLEFKEGYNEPSLKTYLAEIFSSVKEFFDSTAVGNSGEPMNFPRSCRVFMPALGGIDRYFALSGNDFSSSGNRAQFFRFILQLRYLLGVRDFASSLVFSTNALAHEDSSFLSSLHVVCDNIISVEGLEGRIESIPTEFKELSAFLHVLKLSGNYNLVPHHPVANQFGIKRHTRKLVIEQLHLPPDEGTLTTAHSCSVNSVVGNLI